MQRKYSWSISGSTDGSQGIYTGSTGSTRRDVGDVEYIDLGNKSTNMGKISTILPREKRSSDTDPRSSFCTMPSSHNTNENNLRPSVDDAIQSDRRMYCTDKIFLQGTPSTRSRGTHTSDGTLDTIPAKQDTEKGHASGRANVNDELEGCITMVGNSKFDTRKVCRSDSRTDRSSLGKRHQSNSMQPMARINVHSHQGGRNTRTSSVRTYAEAVGQNVSHQCETDGQTYQERSGPRLWDALRKARRGDGTFQGSCKWEIDDRGGQEFSKTSADRISPQIQFQSGNDSPCTWNSKRNRQTENALKTEYLFRQYLRDMPQEKNRHTIVRTRRTTKLATNEQLNLPLHVKKIPAMDVKAIEMKMNDTTKRRFQDTMEKLLHLLRTPDREPNMGPKLSVPDIEDLVQAKILSKVTHEEERKRPSNQWIIPFTVIEPADDTAETERRRFIAWTKEDNTRIKNEYLPYVPLKHAAYYLHRAKESYGLKRDMACGFYQVPIPLYSRAKFRFRSENGELYELKVMPMGHRCAPEIMHTITATLAGDPKYCTEQGAYSDSFQADVYVDGLRFAGTIEQTEKYKDFVDKRAQEVGVTFKDIGKEPMQQYVFNGVEYCHEEGKVRMGPNIVKRMQNDRFRNTTYGKLESAVGRLVHASSVLGEPIANYHFTLKLVRRRINALNNNPSLLDRTAYLPPYVTIELTRWKHILISNRLITPPPHPDTVPHRHRIYTDASGTGWGAILYLDFGPIVCVGDRWEDDFVYEVNRAETRAVRLAFEKLAHHFRRGTCIDLFIDNTSCLASIKKKSTKSDGISMELTGLLNFLRKQGIAVQPHYVASKENPADPLSRQRTAKGETSD